MLQMSSRRLAMAGPYPADPTLWWAPLRHAMQDASERGRDLAQLEGLGSRLVVDEQHSLAVASWRRGRRVIGGYERDLRPRSHCPSRCAQLATSSVVITSLSNGILGAFGIYTSRNR
jgi:hypothetical protein